MTITFTFGSIAVTIFSDVRHLRFPSVTRHSGQSFTLLRQSLQRICPLSQRYIGVHFGGTRHTGHSKIFLSPSSDIVESSSYDIGKAAAIFDCYSFPLLAENL